MGRPAGEGRSFRIGVTVRLGDAPFAIGLRAPSRPVASASEPRREPGAGEERPARVSVADEVRRRGSTLQEGWSRPSVKYTFLSTTVVNKPGERPEGRRCRVGVRVVEDRATDVVGVRDTRRSLAVLAAAPSSSSAIDDEEKDLSDALSSNTDVLEAFFFILGTRNCATGIELSPVLVVVGRVTAVRPLLRRGPSERRGCSASTVELSEREMARAADTRPTVTRGLAIFVCEVAATAVVGVARGLGAEAVVAERSMRPSRRVMVGVEDAVVALVAMVFDSLQVLLNGESTLRNVASLRAGVAAISSCTTRGDTGAAG